VQHAGVVRAEVDGGEDRFEGDDVLAEVEARLGVALHDAVVSHLACEGDRVAAGAHADELRALAGEQEARIEEREARSRTEPERRDDVLADVERAAEELPGGRQRLE